MLGNSLVTERLAAPQEGLIFMELLDLYKIAAKYETVAWH
jgi:hypothetical protein